MMMWKKVLAAVSITTMTAVSLAGCVGSSGATVTTEAAAAAADSEASADSAAGQNITSETKVWKVAFTQTTDHPQYKVMEEFGRKFNEATDGRYAFEIYPNETLGAQRETLEQIQSGTIELSIVNNTHPGSVSDYFKAFDMPFVFDSVEEAMTFMKESPVMDKVKADCEQYGFRIATYLPAGTRSMYTANKPIYSVDDMKGLKVRTMESDVYVQMMDAFGGSAAPMAMGELYTAIQSGVVDGAENNEITYVNSKHYEVAPYWSQTNHLIVPDWLIMSNDAYESLSDEDRAIFDELVAGIMDEVYAQWNDNVDELMASLDTSKVTIVPEEEIDSESFREAIAPVNEALVNSNEKIKEVYDAIMEMKAE